MSESKEQTLQKKTADDEAQQKKIQESFKSAVYVKSVEVDPSLVEVKGYDFNKGLDYNEMFKTYISTGFQATSLGLAIEEVNRMIKWRLSDEPIEEDE